MIHFYLPAESWPEDLADASQFFLSPKRGGHSVWTIQTFLRLREIGVQCELTKVLPDAGIVIAHTRNLRKRILPGRHRFIVVIEADRGRRPYCQFHVQQNPMGMEQANSLLQARLDRLITGFQASNHFIPYWPQPGLIPRNPDRGDRLENIGFMGRLGNLEPELLGSEFQNRLAAMGMRSVFQGEVGKWHDYREVDAVVAVRDFTGAPHIRKPASKLINAWHAGVPALLSPESAYLCEKKSDLDFIEVRSAEDVLKGLRQLRTDPDFRRRMVENGARRAIDRSEQAVAMMWKRYLEECVVPACQQWQHLGVARRSAFYLARCLGYFDRIR